MGEVSEPPLWTDVSHDAPLIERNCGEHVEVRRRNCGASGIWEVL